MSKPKVPLMQYLSSAKRANYDQFRGKHSGGNNAFIIAAVDPKILVAATNAKAINDVPGFSKQAFILTLGTGHKELYLDPRIPDYRDAHLAFLDAIGVGCSERDIVGLDSDHAYAKSAAINQVGVVKQNLIELGVNRAHGRGWEQRLTHDKLNEPVKRGELAALVKAQGLPLFSFKDPAGSLKAAAKQMIALGLAPSTDEEFLLRRAEDCMLDKQAQDVGEALRLRQVNLEPGKPLIPSKG